MSQIDIKLFINIIFNKKLVFNLTLNHEYDMYDLIIFFVLIIYTVPGITKHQFPAFPSEKSSSSSGSKAVVITTTGTDHNDHNWQPGGNFYIHGKSRRWHRYDRSKHHSRLASKVRPILLRSLRVLWVALGRRCGAERALRIRLA